MFTMNEADIETWSNQTMRWPNIDIFSACRNMISMLVWPFIGKLISGKLPILVLELRKETKLEISSKCE